MEGVATGSRLIAAPRQVIYSILADYQEHARILPPKYFKKLEVLEGGIGNGTRIHGEMAVLGRIVTFEHVVTEPEPGRQLLESDTRGVSTTRFVLDDDGGSGTRLLIQTNFITEREGFLGRIERWLTTIMLERIYRQELLLIEMRARSQPRPENADHGARDDPPSAR